MEMICREEGNEDVMRRDRPLVLTLCLYRRQRKCIIFVGGKTLKSEYSNRKQIKGIIEGIVSWN